MKKKTANLVVVYFYLIILTLLTYLDKIFRLCLSFSFCRFYSELDILGKKKESFFGLFWKRKPDTVAEETEL